MCKANKWFVVDVTSNGGYGYGQLVERKMRLLLVEMDWKCTSRCVFTISQRGSHVQNY